MASRSKRAGGDVETPSPGTWKPGLGGDIQIREGGTPTTATPRFLPGFAVGAISTLIISLCIFGILTGAGVILPWYSWGCIGVLVGVINPMGRPKRP